MSNTTQESLLQRVDALERRRWEDLQKANNPCIESIHLNKSDSVEVTFKAIWFLSKFLEGPRQYFPDSCCYRTFMRANGRKSLGWIA